MRSLMQYIKEQVDGKKNTITSLNRPFLLNNLSVI
jgi:hypothetical protein